MSKIRLPHWFASHLSVTFYSLLPAVLLVTITSQSSHLEQILNICHLAQPLHLSPGI